MLVLLFITIMSFNEWFSVTGTRENESFRRVLKIWVNLSHFIGTFWNDVTRKHWVYAHNQFIRCQIQYHSETEFIIIMTIFKVFPLKFPVVYCECEYINCLFSKSISCGFSIIRFFFCSVSKYVSCLSLSKCNFHNLSCLFSSWLHWNIIHDPMNFRCCYTRKMINSFPSVLYIL